VLVAWLYVICFVSPQSLSSLRLSREFQPHEYAPRAAIPLSGAGNVGVPIAAAAPTAPRLTLKVKRKGDLIIADAGGADEQVDEDAMMQY